MAPPARAWVRACRCWTGEAWAEATCGDGAVRPGTVADVAGSGGGAAPGTVEAVGEVDRWRVQMVMEVCIGPHVGLFRTDAHKF